MANLWKPAWIPSIMNDLKVCKIEGTCLKPFDLSLEFQEAPQKSNIFVKESQLFQEKGNENEKEKIEKCKNPKNKLKYFDNCVPIQNSKTFKKLLGKKINKKIYKNFMKALKKHNETNIKFDEKKKNVFINSKKFENPQKMFQFLFGEKIKIPSISKMSIFLKIIKSLNKNIINSLSKQVKTFLKK